MSVLSIPNTALKYILFQRTQYLSVSPLYASAVWRGWIPWRTQAQLVDLEVQRNPGRIEQLYAEDMQREYELLKPHLPAQASAILDIGCGVAGIDVYLHRHYASQNPRIYLLDKSKVDTNIYYGYKSNGAFYNSLEAANETLVRNQVPADRITLLEANEKCEIPVDQPVNLALSLISWGYHYPVRTYLQQVYELLAPAGQLILDVRRGTSGVEELRAVFDTVEVVSSNRKSERILAVK